MVPKCCYWSTSIYVIIERLIEILKSSWIQTFNLSYKDKSNEDLKTEKKTWADINDTFQVQLTCLLYSNNYLVYLGIQQTLSQISSVKELNCKMKHIFHLTITEMYNTPPLPLGENSPVILPVGTPRLS